MAIELSSQYTDLPTPGSRLTPPSPRSVPHSIKSPCTNPRRGATSSLRNLMVRLAADGGAVRLEGFNDDNKTSHV